MLIDLKVGPYFKVTQINSWANCLPLFQRCSAISSKGHMDIKILEPCKVNLCFRLEIKHLTVTPKASTVSKLNRYYNL